jgi:hypothetical protein
MKTDSLFYRLFQALPRLFFDLVGLPTLPAEQYRFQSKERIAGLSLVQMEALAEALLEFSGPADLEQWVRAHVET